MRLHLLLLSVLLFANVSVSRADVARTPSARTGVTWQPFASLSYAMCQSNAGEQGYLVDRYLEWQCTVLDLDGLPAPASVPAPGV